jgi:hypothetical protein
MSITTYRWVKHRHGFAIITLEVSKIKSNSNEIFECYSGNGWTGQGQIDEIPEDGYDYLKLGAKKGLEYAFSFIEGNWRIKLHRIEGMFITDTNATVVGYAVIRAFLDNIDYPLLEDKIEELEKFVQVSWQEDFNHIPNFKELTFEPFVNKF